MKNNHSVRLLLLVFVIFMAGCNSPNPPEAEEGAGAGAYAHEQVRQKDWTRSLFGPGPINYGMIHEQSKGYDPVTESNVTGKSFRSLEAPRQTEEDDQSMIENVVDEIPGATPAVVILLGGNAWVKVDVDEGLSKKEEDKLLDEVEKKLKKANPRYDYDISVNEFMK